MNIFTLRVTDERSVWVRFVFSVMSSAVIIAGFCFFEHSWRTRGLMAGILLAWSVIELILDKWRLRNPDASRERERQLRLYCIIGLMIGMFAIIFLTG